MDSRLYALLDLPVGGEAAVGEKSFVATQALISEPDQGNMNEMLAPRGMINFADLAATGVVQPGSLVRYRYLFAGTEEQLARFEQWLEPQLEEGQRWQDVRDGQPAMAATLKRAEGFLLLAASLGVALAGAAIALAARRYGDRNTDNVAIMKALGASRTQVLSHSIVRGGDFSRWICRLWFAMGIVCKLERIYFSRYSRRKLASAYCRCSHGFRLHSRVCDAAGVCLE